MRDFLRDWLVLLCVAGALAWLVTVTMDAAETVIRTRRELRRRMQDGEAERARSRHLWD